MSRQSLVSKAAVLLLSFFRLWVQLLPRKVLVIGKDQDHNGVGPGEYPEESDLRLVVLE